MTMKKFQLNLFALNVTIRLLEFDFVIGEVGIVVEVRSLRVYLLSLMTPVHMAPVWGSESSDTPSIRDFCSLSLHRRQ